MVYITVGPVLGILAYLIEGRGRSARAQA